MSCHDLCCLTNRWKVRAKLREFAISLAEVRVARLPESPELDELLTELAALYDMQECGECLELRLAQARSAGL